MFEVTVNMNSSVEDVLGFKCCSLPGMNLEIIFHNRGDRPQTVPDCFTLENDRGREVFRNIYPPWRQKIPPGDCAAVYCQMDEASWSRYRTLLVSDENGRSYRIPINRGQAAAGAS